MSKEQITQAVAIRMYLHDDLGFTHKEVGANKSTIDAFAQVPDAMTHLYTIAQRAVRKSANTKGYIISAMKSEVKEWNEAIKELCKGSLFPRLASLGSGVPFGVGVSRGWCAPKGFFALRT